MAESSLLKNVMLRLSALKHATTRVVTFRNNTGMGWQGKGKKRADGSITLENARPIHAGLITGSSDLIGWTSLIITSEMVGKRVAVFTAIETKDLKGKKPSPDQMTFINNVKNAGGIATWVRTEEEASAVIIAGI